METGAELVTMDHHFEKISGLVYRLFASPEQLHTMKPRSHSYPGIHPEMLRFAEKKLSTNGFFFHAPGFRGALFEQAFIDCYCRRALVMVPTRQLREDHAQKFRNRLPDHGLPAALQDTITIQTYAWMSRHYTRFDSRAFDYIAVDEAHHNVAPTVQKVIQSFTPRTLIGFTATDQLIVDTLTRYFTGNGLPFKQGLVFCVSVQHARRMAALLKAHGISAEAVSGRDSRSEKHIQAYQEGNINFLATCSLLNEGWDSPRELFVSTGTIKAWVKNKKIFPAVTVPMGRRKINYFAPDQLDQIRQDLGLKRHDETTQYDDFFEFLETGDFTMSYKMVMLLTLLQIADNRGSATWTFWWRPIPHFTATAWIPDGRWTNPTVPTNTRKNWMIMPS